MVRPSSGTNPVTEGGPAANEARELSVLSGGFAAVAADAQRLEVLERVWAALDARYDVVGAEEGCAAALHACPVATYDRDGQLTPFRGRVRVRAVALGLADAAPGPLSEPAALEAGPHHQIHPTSSAGAGWLA